MSLELGTWKMVAGLMWLSFLSIKGVAYGYMGMNKQLADTCSCISTRLFLISVLGMDSTETGMSSLLWFETHDGYSRQY